MEELKKQLREFVIYLVRLADRLGIEPLDAAKEKITINEGKYPADKVKGSAKKYSDY